MPDRRNPYLILGLDFGASPEDATMAFARTSRRIKKSSSAPYTIEDATWALHQIEQAEANHGMGVTLYRVPADPAVFAEGDFEPDPQALERTTDDDGKAVERLVSEVVFELLASPLEALTDSGLDLAYEQRSRSR